MIAANKPLPIRRLSTFRRLLLIQPRRVSFRHPIHSDRLLTYKIVRGHGISFRTCSAVHQHRTDSLIKSRNWRNCRTQTHTHTHSACGMCVRIVWPVGQTVRLLSGHTNRNFYNRTAYTTFTYTHDHQSITLHAICVCVCVFAT